MDRGTILCSDNYTYNVPDRTREPFIEKQKRNQIMCKGRVTETDHHELFYSKLHKLVNSLFRGEAYQFGHQTIEYLIRVEELSDGYSEHTADFFLYGNYMGRIYPGDEVEITASDRRGRYVVSRIYNRNINSELTPGLQLPAWVVRLMAVVFILAIVISVICLRNYMESNGMVRVLSPAALIAMGYVWIRKKIRRFRR